MCKENELILASITIMTTILSQREWCHAESTKYIIPLLKEMIKDSAFMMLLK